MSRPEFSIIITYYNNGHKNNYLNLVLWGLSRQTCKSFELILIDNNSPIPLIVKNQDLARVKIHRMNYNYGQCTARNLGAELASGKRIIFNDGDHVYSNNFLETHKNANPDIFITLFCGRDPKKRFVVPFNKVTDMIRHYEINPITDNDLLHYKKKVGHFLNTIPIGSSYNRKVFLQHKYDTSFDFGDKEKGKGWEDIDLGLRLYKSGASFGGSRKAFSIHIHHHFFGVAPSPLSEKEKGKINWVKLERKHPDIKELTGEWYDYTYQALYKL